MLKKIIPIILTLCLVFCVSVMAENEDTASDNGNPQPMREMPVQGDERPQGGNQGDQMPQGELTPPQNNTTNSDRSTTPQENNVPGNETTHNTNNTQNPNESFGQNGQFPGDVRGGFPGEMQNGNQTTEEPQSSGFIGFVKTYSTPITSVILLALAFVFVLFYKKRSY